MDTKAHLLRAELFWDRVIMLCKQGVLPQDMLKKRGGGWNARAMNFAELAEPLSQAIYTATFIEYKPKKVYKWAQKQKAQVQ
jgi:hypothetical protein